jgi:hypothetical protein
VPITGSSIVPDGRTKTSTRSVSTIGPSATMLRSRNSIFSTPPVNPAIVDLIVSRPVTGAIGMLWYTASSVKCSASSSALMFDHAAQNRRTMSIGLSVATDLLPVVSVDRDGRHPR